MFHLPIGFGTYKLTPDVAYNMVRKALQLGYRHIDTATLYKNEEAVGRAIRDSGISRSEIFLTTKIQVKDMKKGKIEEAIKASLEKLYWIDMLVLHAPTEHFVDDWNKLCKLKEKYPSVHKIGVSNFDICHLEKLPILPVYNQIELSPFLLRSNLITYCQKNHITIVSHSPLTKGEKLDHPLLQKIAMKYGIHPAQVMISWAMMKKYIPIFRTSNEKHLEQNRNIVTLSSEDMLELDNVKEIFATHPKLLV